MDYCAPVRFLKPIFAIQLINRKPDSNGGHESYEGNEGWAGKFVNISVATLRQVSPDTSAGSLWQFLLPLWSVLGCCLGPLWVALGCVTSIGGLGLLFGPSVDGLGRAVTRKARK